MSNRESRSQYVNVEIEIPEEDANEAEGVGE